MALYCAQIYCAQKTLYIFNQLLRQVLTLNYMTCMTFDFTTLDFKILCINLVICLNQIYFYSDFFCLVLDALIYFLRYAFTLFVPHCMLM
uniref:Uncharacterized protein n=1 Tax=Arundo donax TaxID=35708 RepID=A0A0A9DIL5_ARUDO